MIENYDGPWESGLDLVTGCLLLASPWAILFWILSLLPPPFRPGRYHILFQSIILCTGITLMAVFWKYSPGDFMGWYLD